MHMFIYTYIFINIYVYVNTDVSTYIINAEVELYHSAFTLRHQIKRCNLDMDVLMCIYVYTFAYIYKYLH